MIERIIYHGMVGIILIFTASFFSSGIPQLSSVICFCLAMAAMMEAYRHLIRRLCAYRFFLLIIIMFLGILDILMHFSILKLIVNGWILTALFNITVKTESYNEALKSYLKKIDDE